VADDTTLLKRYINLGLTVDMAKELVAIENRVEVVETAEPSGGPEVTTAEDPPLPYNAMFYLLMTGAPEDGTVRFTWNGQQTAPIAFDADDATIQAAFEPLSNIGAGNIEIQGEFSDGRVVGTFTGTLAGAAQNLPTLSNNSLSGGSSPGVEIGGVGVGGGPREEATSVDELYLDSNFGVVWARVLGVWAAQDAVGHFYENGQMSAEATADGGEVALVTWREDGSEKSRVTVDDAFAARLTNEFNQTVASISADEDFVDFDLKEYEGTVKTSEIGLSIGKQRLRYGAGPYFTALPGGAVKIGQVTAPADGDLNSGEMALWFDPTEGSAKLMIKAKDESGNVVEGEVALT